jgi:two-component system nitrate/nitrite response regulator NarL
MRAVLCDDHRLFADALATVLRHAGVDVAAVLTRPDEAVERACRGDVDVCVMDVGFPGGLHGLDASRALADQPAGPPVVLLTAHTDLETIDAAIATGAAGVLFKVQPVREICDAVVRVANGGVVLDARFMLPPPQPVAARDRTRDLVEFLTPREREVLRLLVAGLRTDAIAQRLGIGVATTRGHVQSILTKLQVHSRIKAVAIAVAYGLADPHEQPGEGVGGGMPPAS